VFGDEGELDSAERLIDEWQSTIEDRATKARALSQRLGALTSTARSRDGLVEATVAASGVLTGLHLDERVRRQPAAWIARQVLAVTQQALDQLAAQATEATQETVGEDSPEGRAVVASYTTRLTQAAEHDGDTRR
jgi:DNA-binding protein YbaB